MDCEVLTMGVVQVVLRLLHPIFLHQDLCRLPWRPAAYREVPPRDHECNEHPVSDSAWVHRGQDRPVSVSTADALLEVLTDVPAPTVSRSSFRRPRYAASCCSDCGCPRATRRRLSRSRRSTACSQVCPHNYILRTLHSDLPAGAFVSLLPTYIACISPREKLGARLGMPAPPQKLPV